VSRDVDTTVRVTQCLSRVTWCLARVTQRPKSRTTLLRDTVEGLQERRGVWEESSSVMRDALSSGVMHCLRCSAAVPINKRVMRCLLCRYRVAKKRVLLDVADGLRRNIACLVCAPTLCPTHNKASLVRA